jgi:hypothetical protein
LYHYYFVELRDCLEKRGFPFAPVPSLEAFVANYQRGFLWSPYQLISPASMSAESWTKLNRECPRNPPASELYGAPLPQP